MHSSLAIGWVNFPFLHINFPFMHMIIYKRLHGYLKWGKEIKGHFKFGFWGSLEDHPHKGITPLKLVYSNWRINRKQIRVLKLKKEFWSFFVGCILILFLMLDKSEFSSCKCISSWEGVFVVWSIKLMRYI